MRVVIPVFKGRVAPVFDWAGRLLIADVVEREVSGELEHEIADVVPMQRPALLKREGAQVLICGGISGALATILGVEGIELVTGIVGDARDVLGAYAEGRLDRAQWAMPGWCGRSGAGPGMKMRRNRSRGERRGGRGGRGRGGCPWGGEM